MPPWYVQLKLAMFDVRTKQTTAVTPTAVTPAVITLSGLPFLSANIEICTTEISLVAAIKTRLKGVEFMGGEKNRQKT